MTNGYVQALTWTLNFAYGQRGIAAPKLYKKEERLTLREHSSSFGGVLVAHHFSFYCGVLLYVFTFWVPSCDVHYDFCINTMFGPSLPLIVCRRVHILFTLFVLAAYGGVHHILCCVFASFVLVLCTLCCHFLWILHSWLPLRNSLTFFFIMNTDFRILTVQKGCAETSEA
jgi:hypothetical protein